MDAAQHHRRAKVGAARRRHAELRFEKAVLMPVPAGPA